MSSVSVREFSYNPSGMFARVERGETIEVTRHGKVIAVLLPGSGTLGRYASRVTNGAVKLKATTTGDLDRLTRFPFRPMSRHSTSSSPNEPRTIGDLPGCIRSDHLGVRPPA
jgi:prevent-host-death family protein